MSTLELILVALGLAADAFAVALAAAVTGGIPSRRAALRLCFHFGLFQFLMPVLGWFLGTTVSATIEEYDHWFAFLLLVYVGGKMILSSQRIGKQHTVPADPTRGTSLLILSLATSIDAFAVGLSLAMLNLRIWYPSALIGIVTAVVSLGGVWAGRHLGVLFGRWAEIIGGAILIAIGLRVLYTHLG